MPSKKQYDLVQNDDYDTRIPLHPEEAFHHGITFQAKRIASAVSPLELCNSPGKLENRLGVVLISAPPRRQSYRPSHGDAIGKPQVASDSITC
ncbi:hypothetical protein Trydic_g2744 [Trypoxylus dichotomus]